MAKTLHSISSVITLLAFSFSAQSQIQLLSSDITSIGDQIVRYQDTIPTYGPGGAGANQTWDFSSALVDVTTTTNVVATSSTPYAANFSSSNYAMTNGANSYLYFTHNANSQATTGAAGDLLGTGEIIVAPFSNALTLHNFPRTFGSYFNDTYAFQAEADGAAFGVYRVRLTHSGHVYDTTDAHGTLITPTGTYDALRVKSTDYTTDVIEVKLTSFLPWTPFSTTQDTSITFSWHAKMEKLAIAEFTYDSIGNPRQFTYSAIPPVVTTDVSSVDSGHEIQFYPNPISGHLWISGIESNRTPVQIEIFALDGKIMLSNTYSSFGLDVSNLSSGLYIIHLRSEDGRLSKTDKILIE